MHSFAHMADAHLGAHREPNLRKMELEAFDSAMMKCLELGVDFVLVCGDLFHVGIPDLTVVNAAVRSMMKVQKEGVPIYAIYGSHDYTPNGTSVIDVLNTAGVLTNVFRPRMVEGSLKLGVTIDARSGAKIAGISARRIGLESRYFEAMDRASLEEEEGFKVFAFHSGLTELKPSNMGDMETIGVDLLPKGFDYYAGGHIHQRGEYEVQGFNNIVFPGPLFTGHGKDLEATARGEKRGIYFVEFDDKVRRKTFVPILGFDGIFREYDLTGFNARDAGSRMTADLDGIEVTGKLVVVRAFGELIGGRVADIAFSEIKVRLSERGAIHVYLNRNSLKSREMSRVAAPGTDPATIERDFFTSELGRVTSSSDRLKGVQGVATGVELLRVLRQEVNVGESKKDYGARMNAAGRKTLGIEELEK